jgi:hypothetical protein
LLQCDNVSSMRCLSNWRLSFDQILSIFVIIFVSGQIELYSHIPVMREFADALQKW